MAKAARKPLEQWQIDDAGRLKALWDRREPKISQVVFAAAHGIGETQGIVWQYLNAKIPLNLPVALKFARGLHCEVRDFSPTLAEQLPRAPHKGAEQESAAYNIPDDQIEELLDCFEQLSNAEREDILEKLRAAATAHREVAARLKQSLNPPPDRSVAKALPIRPDRLAPNEQPPRRRFVQLPLFGRRRNQQ